MTSFSKTFALAAAFATITGASLHTATNADAGGKGREIYLETFTFKKSMHGYSGHSGNFYCDYQRLPNRKCDANGQNCKIVSWTLQQICQ